MLIKNPAQALKGFIGHNSHQLITGDHIGIAAAAVNISPFLSVRADDNFIDNVGQIIAVRKRIQENKLIFSFPNRLFCIGVPFQGNIPVGG